MEDRSRFRDARAYLAATLLLTLVATTGCQGALAGALWIIKGPNIDAEFNQMEEKKVCVVCRSVDYSFNYPTVPKDLARQVSVLLGANVPKIEIIDQRKVDEWMDNNGSWDEYVEVGRALDADLVLGLDLEQFSLLESQTLYRGKANVTMKLYDCESGNLIVDRPMPQAVYPPNAAKATFDIQEPAFRREFLANLADQIGRHFYPHDPRAYFAADAAAFQGSQTAQ